MRNFFVSLFILLITASNVFSQAATYKGNYPAPSHVRGSVILVPNAAGDSLVVFRGVQTGDIINTVNVDTVSANIIGTVPISSLDTLSVVNTAPVDVQGDVGTVPPLTVGIDSIAVSSTSAALPNRPSEWFTLLNETPGATVNVVVGGVSYGHLMYKDELFVSLSNPNLFRVVSDVPATVKLMWAN